ncbi:MAG: hypothetical protein LH478_01060, partial [Chitinophagaceae bacterium]|nr:hypothetical protein [Chitinophagaceae bacterium]
MKDCLLFLISILCISGISTAQLCTGSKGDPIINITFGTTQQPISTSKTNLTYVRSCPYDTSSYTIQNLIFGCGETPSAKSWHMLAGDHTKDLNGQYMLVNASWAQGVTHPLQVIYRDTATGLCSNTTYEFSAWLANPMSNLACDGKPLLTNIRFTVTSLKGDTIATATTGPLPVRDGKIWQKNGVAFSLPSNVDALVVTVSMDPERGCGNAIVVDDITLVMCGPSVMATLDDKTEPANVCADYKDPFLLKASYSPGFNDPMVQWQSSLDSGKKWSDMPGINTTSYKIPRRTSGTIVYRMAVAERANISSLNCRVVSNPIYTEIHPVPPHNPPKNVIGCISKDLRLPEANLTSLKNEWSGPNGFSSTDPKAIVSNISSADTGMYLLKQVYYFGCTTLDTFNLKVFPSTTISTRTLYGVCQGQTIQLSASGTGTFKWTPATGLSSDVVANPVITPKDSAMYKVVVTNNFGCKDSADVTINVFRKPVAAAGIEHTIVAGDTVKLMGFTGGTAII